MTPTAIITGASSGIGEATARALSHAGYAVALAARRMDRIEALASELGDNAIAVDTDVADEDSCRALIERAKSELGRIDVLVNNAGVMLLGPVGGADTAEWRTMVEVNLLGLMYCTHAALPVMQEQGGGHVVNVSSVAGRVARLGNAVYSATKFGVVAFSEALREEALHSNIRVTIIEPGFVETELQGHNKNPVVVENIEKFRERIGDVLTAEDIADAIVFAVQAPPRMSVNEVLIRPTRQQ
jgi:NADP-dependent 3-hydroxy acid dehydrogenase YdfG